MVRNDFGGAEFFQSSCEGLYLPRDFELTGEMTKEGRRGGRIQESAHDESEEEQRTARAKAFGEMVSQAKANVDGSHMFYGPLRPNEVQIIDIARGQNTARWDEVVYSDKQDRERQNALKQYLKERGPIRRLQALPGNWREILVRLSMGSCSHRYKRARMELISSCFHKRAS